MGYISETLGMTEEEFQEHLDEARWDLENLVEAHTEPSPIPEIATEIWNDPKALLVFCAGTFEEWELAAIDQQSQNWTQVELLTNLRGMARSHFRRLKK